MKISNRLYSNLNGTAYKQFLLILSEIAFTNKCHVNVINETYTQSI